jgi:hypothetical protein
VTEYVLEETASDGVEAIPDGDILTAEIANCEERDSLFDDDKNPGTKRREVSFRFRITEPGEFYDRVVYGNTPTTFTTHSDCKLRMWVQEIMGVDDLAKGFRFNTETLLGLPCRVVIAQYPKKAGGVGNRVQDVFRASTSSAPLASDIF